MHKEESSYEWIKENGKETHGTQVPERFKHIQGQCQEAPIGLWEETRQDIKGPESGSALSPAGLCPQAILNNLFA